MTVDCSVQPTRCNRTRCSVTAHEYCGTQDIWREKMTVGSIGKLNCNRAAACKDSSEMKKKAEFPPPSTWYDGNM